VAAFAAMHGANLLYFIRDPLPKYPPFANMAAAVS